MNTIRPWLTSEEANQKRLDALRSPESRLKISLAHKGKLPKNFAEMQQKGWDAAKKEVLTYSGIHAWVRRTWGTAREYGKCDLCGKKEIRSTKIHWANKDHRYTRNREDWMVACRPCHFHYDRKHNGVDFFGGRNLTIES